MILKDFKLLTKAITFVFILIAGNLFSVDKPIRILASPALENTSSSNVIVGSNHQVQLGAPGSSYDKMVTGMVSLKIKTNHPDFISSYDMEVDVKIETWDVNNNPLPTTLQTLKVKHQPFGNVSYKDQDYIIFNLTPWAYTIKTTVMQIKKNTVPVANFENNMVIESSIDYLRYDLFNTNAPANLQVTAQNQDNNGLTNEVIKVSWGSVSGATHYELEYMSVNDYEGANLDITAFKDGNFIDYDFKNNSTRIVTANTSYSVPNIFDRGFFLCRVRAYGKNISTSNPSLAPYFGNWTWNTNSGSINSFTTANAINSGWIPTSHFEKNLNWQYNATFAEEAKHKDVINYADGSLRSRQTITKMNSNNTTLVGENVYDYTGRSAISILPTPLPSVNNIITSSPGSWSFGYRPGENLTDASSTPKKYSKEDFDLDPLTPPVDPCDPPPVNAMKTTSGASKYYSPANPDKSGYQAYVPDANKFPFTQTEYTPDNTGRIKKQGGVGVDHQLGTDHETKYFYGTPEQIELDRLFGSEVGDASHYQKNMVIDANNQVSLTYMDMEGKTIATSLAGSAPANMKAMPNQPSTAVQLTADMFNKDPNNQSENNVIGPDGESIEFVKSILITESNAVNTFDYQMSVANFQDACLKPNVCMNCVYNFEFSVSDDCGSVIYTSGDKMIGRFTVVNNQTVFTTQCYNPLTYNFQELNSSSALPTVTFAKPGVYYVNKKLTINKDARDFYLKKYLDKANNLCIKDLQDIKNEMPQPDPNDCAVKCAACFASLGTKDDFVSKGKGTEEEWEVQYEQCKSMCGYPKSTCEINLAMLLGDVSPNGQYGNTTDPGDQLSVFNQMNLLPKNIAQIAITTTNTVPNNINNGPVIATGLSYWKKPIYYKNNTQQYLDKKGKRFKVMLTKVPNSPNPGQYSLHVSSILQVFTTNTVGVFYTYPENLFNLSDFLSIWQPSFAKSLVKYHPEYCYYEDCENTFSKKLFGDSTSSNDYDIKLMYTSTFVDAVNRQLIIPNGIGGWKLYLDMDPANAPNYYAPFANNQPMVTKHDNYVSANNGNLSMTDFAAYTHRCATQFASNQFSGPCTNMCSPLTNATSAQNTTMHNQEWNTLKAIYFGEKQKMIYKLQNARRLSGGQCNYYNACIGVPDFDGYNTPLVKFDPNNNDEALQTSAYFNAFQPCNQTIKDLYAAKTKRFGYVDDAESQAPSLDEIAYQQFIQTGRCPMAQDLQDLSNALAAANKFAATSEALQNYPAMTINFYNYINNASPAQPPYTAYLWKATSITNNGLNVNFTKASNNTVAKFVQFNQPTNQFNVVWSNVQGVIQFQHTGFSGPNSTFSCNVKELVGSTIVLKTVTGVTDISISGCTFKEICKPNDLAKNIQNIFNQLKGSNNFESTSPIALGGPATNTPLGPYLSKIQQLIGQNSTPPNFQWKKVNSLPPAYDIYDASSPTCFLRLNLTTFNNNPISATNHINNVKIFTKIKSDYQNFFVMEARDVNNAFLGYVKGEAFKYCGEPIVPVSMGTCELPEPGSCKTPYHKNQKDLEKLLKDILEGHKFTPPASANVANVSNNINLTSNLLTNFMPLNSNIPVNNHQVTNNFHYIFSQVITETSGPVTNDSLEFILKSPCKPPIQPGDDDDDDNQNLFAIEPPPCSETEYCRLWLKTNNKATTNDFTLANLVKVHKLIANGPVVNNNYNNFVIVADFNTTNGIVKDTLFGSSCYELQNCIPCAQGPNYCCTEIFTEVSQDEITVPPSENPFSTDSLAIADSSAYIDTGVLAYTQYTTQVQTLNANMAWTSTNPNYVTPLSLKALRSNGYFQVKSNYTKFIQDFDSTLDEHVYLCNMQKFVKDHGAKPRPQRCYKRLLKAYQNYNTIALAQTGPTLTPMIDTVFYHGDYLDSVNVYIDYLNSAAVTSTAPLQPDSFFNSRAGLPPSTIPQACQDLYDSYVTAYTQYVNNPNNINNCGPEFTNLVPLYAIQVFMDANYCCPSNYIAWTNYINSFYNTNQCPEPLRTFVECDVETTPTPEICAERWANYYAAVQAYNASTYATTNNYFLSLTLFAGPESFNEQGYCKCVPDYIAYLYQYIGNLSSYPAQPPVPITTWEGCGPVPSGCRDIYNDYVTAITNYVDWRTTLINPFQYPDPVIYDFESFNSLGYCNCAPGFIAFINAIISSAVTDVTYIQNNFSIGFFCAQVTYTCPTQNSLDNVISPPVPESQNPCVKYQQDLFEANAKAKYEQYLKDQTALFIKNYNAYCLGATESLIRTYTSKEFHYTLYYYDQAGNLIKTIPPEGLDVPHYLSITSYLSPNAIKAKNDRKIKTKSLFTNHGMATTYQYNSLNQLVKQKMPDHDALEYIKYQFNYGIDTNVTVVSSQFPEANKGYMAATEVVFDSYIGNNFRGKLFESTDGSQTWSPIKNTIGADFNKVQFVNVFGTDYGFAVGTDGTFAYSFNGGAEWDMIPIHEHTNDNSTLNDLHFWLKSNGNLEGVIVGDKGTIIKVVLASATAPNVSTFNTNALTSLPFPATQHVTDIVGDNANTGNYYITVYDTQTNSSKVYTSNGSNSSSGWWQDITNVKLPKLEKIRQIRSPNFYYAIGEDGNLITSNTNADSWQIVATNTSGKFRDVYFASQQIGVALINDASNLAGLYKTNDGGKTWSLFDQPTSPNTYLTLSPYLNPSSNTIHRLTANGTDGLVKRVTVDVTNPNSANIGAVNTSIAATTNDVNDVCVVPYGGGLYALAVGQNGEINFCNDYSQNNITWNALGNAATPGTDLKKALLNVNQLNSSTVPMEGIIISNSGVMFGIDCPDITVNLPIYQVLNLPNTTSTFKDITYDWNNLSNPYSTAYIMQTVGAGNTRISRFSLVNVNSVNNTFYSPSTSQQLLNAPNFGAPVSFVVDGKNNTPGANHFVAVSTTGNIVRGVINDVNVTNGGIVYTDYSQKIIPSKLNDICFNNENNIPTISVVGDGGLYAEKPLSGNNPFKVKNTTYNGDINAVKCVGNALGIPAFYMTSKQGQVSIFGSPAGDNAIIQPTQLSTSSLNDFDFKSVNNGITKLYVVGNDGEAYYSPNGSTYSQISLNGTQHMNTVAFRTQDAAVIACGNDVSAFKLFNLTAVPHKEWYTNQINKLHFTDAYNGYLVGAKGLVRHTQDGGLTWTIAKPPMENLNNKPIDLYAVYTTTIDKAIIAGANDYIDNVSNNTIANAPLLSLQGNAQIWHDIDLNDNGGAFVVGANNNNAKACKLSITSNMASLPMVIAAPTGGNFRSVYAFKGANSGKFIAVGANKTLRVYDGVSNFVQSTSQVNNVFTNANDIIYDVAMSDDNTGYVVGSRSRLAAITVNHGSNAVSLAQQNTAPTYAGVGQNQTHIVTVSLINDVDGFTGGYSGPVIYFSTNDKYGWKFTHEKGKTSTLFWYDRLGRMVLSQNTKQINKLPKAYSYTLYDALGRITEVGEKAENVANTQSTNVFDKIFGAYVGNYFNSSVINDTKLNSWIGDQTGQRREVTKTYYDNDFFFTITTCGPLPNFTQDNLRKRVASVTYEDVWDVDPCSYNHATHYSYDIHGNVKSLLQDNKNFAVPTNNPLIAQRFKRIDYDYDLISGKVNMVSYQAGQSDQFYHQYEYDDDNRITEVKTSRNGLVYETDAKYFYYKHGPLARVEYGHDKVQGTDYAYTLQGWIKGVNSDKLDPGTDIGKDANTQLSANINSIFAQDAMGYSLGYYANDYAPIDAASWTAANRFEADKAGSSLVASTNNLYNGNIGIMATTIVSTLNLTGPLPQNYMLSQLPTANAYKYDQLNRLADAANFNNLNLASNAWDAAAPTNADSYKNLFEYDDNGNITRQKKYDAGGVLMDDIEYYYNKSGSATGKLKQNRLYGIKDNGVTVAGVEDIETITSNPNPFNYAENTINTSAAGSDFNNYRYDEIGNLVYDGFEDISSIVWSVYGKIKEVNNSDPLKKSLKFDYDAMGNRVAKHIYAGSAWLSSTYYVRDAQGNVMATYEHKDVCIANCNTTNQVYGTSYKLIERNIYGSSRCAIDEHQIEFIGPNYNPQTYERIVGSKQFELSNHLGNVISVVSDRKIPIEDGSNIGKTKNYIPQILNATDYYAFGQQMPGRSFSSDSYRYGFNGQEKDDEVSGTGSSYTAEYWQYDSRLGRRWNVDPYVKAEISGYCAFRNNPIVFVDPEGNTDYYNKSGAWIGWDGVDNKAKNIVLTTSTENIIREATAQGNVIAMNEKYYRDIIPVPTDLETQAWDRAYSNTESSFKEQSIVVGKDCLGNQVISEFSGQSAKVSPEQGWTEITDVYEGAVDYDAHTHPASLIYNTADKGFHASSPNSSIEDENSYTTYGLAYRTFQKRPSIVLGLELPDQLEGYKESELKSAKKNPDTWVPIKGSFKKMITFYNETGEIGDKGKKNMDYSKFKNAIKDIKADDPNKCHDTNCK